MEVRLALVVAAMNSLAMVCGFLVGVLYQKKHPIPE